MSGRLADAKDEAELADRIAITWVHFLSSVKQYLH